MPQPKELAMNDDKRPPREIRHRETDTKCVHYQGVWRIAMCGAWERVSQDVASGVIPPDDCRAGIPVRTSTDIAKVNCPRCRGAIVGFIDEVWGFTMRPDGPRQPPRCEEADVPVPVVVAAGEDGAN